MKQKSKLKTIYEAFTEDLPIDEEWFKQRAEKCVPCEYNSNNIDTGELSFAQKLQINTLCSDKWMCTACGCCGNEKISRKTETCGKKNLGLDPEWLALKAETSSSSLIDIELIDNQNYKIFIDEKSQSFVIDLGETSRIVEEVTVLVTKKSGLRIASVKPACSCTVPTQEQIDSESVKMTIKLNTSAFSSGRSYSKTVAVNYYVNAKGTRSTIIKITGFKK